MKRIKTLKLKRKKAIRKYGVGVLKTHYDFKIQQAKEEYKICKRKLKYLSLYGEIPISKRWL